MFSVSTPKLWINYLFPQVQGFQGIQTVDANPSVLICKPKLWMVTLWFGLGKGWEGLGKTGKISQVLV